MAWKDWRSLDPHLILLVAVFALPLGLAVLGAVFLLARAILRVAGVV